MTHVERNRLLTEHLPLVDRVVRGFHRLPSQVDRNDLHSMGVDGLIAAINAFSPERGLFQGYAMLRIKGYILDGLRRGDTCTRKGREHNRAIIKATDEFQAAHGGTLPTDLELATMLDISPWTLRRWQRMGPRVTLALDKAVLCADGIARTVHEIIPDETKDPWEEMEKDEQADLLTRLVAKLSPRKRTILDMLYAKGKTLAEIGKVFEVTEARIWQLRNEAQETLRLGLTRTLAQ